MASPNTASGFAANPNADFPERFHRSFANHLATGTWPVARVKDVQLSLRSTPAAPTIARRWASDFFGKRVTATELGDSLLMLTELVTNAVRHGSPDLGGFVDVHLAVAPQRLRVEVRDVGDGFALPAPKVGPPSGGGFGLLIIDRACSRWGVAHGNPHCVWFELDRGPSA